MKKFKKIVALGCAAVMALSAMSMSAFADEAEKEKAISIAKDAGYTVVENAIDTSIYGDDMVHIQEHADAINEYNKNLTNLNGIARASSYSAWNMNNIYSFTSRNTSLRAIPYYFVPTTTSMYFNALVENVSEQPYMAVNIVKDPSSGTLSYVGSYYIPAKSGADNTYEWNNYKRPLSKGTKYTFTLMSYSNWSYAEMDIYKTAM